MFNPFSDWKRGKGCRVIQKNFSVLRKIQQIEWAKAAERVKSE